jgi:hypothetical protein
LSLSRVACLSISVFKLAPHFICSLIAYFLCFTFFYRFFFFFFFFSQTYDSDHEDENEGKDKVPGGKTAEEVENGGPERNEDKGKDKGKEKEFKRDTAGRDFKKHRKEKEPETSADSSGNWRNSGSSSSKKESDGKGGEKQSAVRPRSDNNRAARRAEKR